MKIKKLIVFPILLLLTATVFLSACFDFKSGKVERLPVYGNYSLVSVTDITHGRKQTKFVNAVFSATRAAGHKVNINSNDALVPGECIDGKFYFICAYHSQRAQSEGERIVDFCIGYIDVLTTKVYILQTIEELIEYNSYAYEIFYKVSVGKIGNNLGIWFKGQKFLVLNTDTHEVITIPYLVHREGYFYKNSVVLRGSNNYCVITASGDYNKVGVAADKDFGFWYSIDNWLIFKQFDETNYYAVDCLTSRRADEETLLTLVERMNYERTRRVEYAGKDYIYTKTYESITFTEYGTENGFSINIDELREKSEEFRYVEELYENKLTFNDLIVQNGEIYISANYEQESLWGREQNSSPTICYLFDPATATVKYIGWLPSLRDLRYVIKG